MFLSHRLRQHPRSKQRIGRLIEPLETRLFLSVAPAMHPGIVVRPLLAGSSSVVGDTPAQIRRAYGMDQISFGNGVTADGSGQTIAIVDPYNDPNVASDLTVFDQQFGIADPPALTVVDQNGGSHLPPTNGSWSGEIATDVEWTHAVAPQAKILLVEANSDNTADLMSGVEYAIKQPGVSVISLSWGGGEFASQTSYDPQFNTPSGHAGVTVLVAAGDNGAASGAQWPASAPNVVSVGGSVVTFADSSGTYGSETSWTSSSGGVSRFETEPSFQTVVQRSGSRSMPDVAINADDNTGLALYDTVPYQGTSGWQTTNGTSVGTPEWAGLVAIADQGRALNGQAPLDGPGQTLPLLYSLYGAPGTTAYSTYTANFNDITVPQNPQATTGLPTLGYDTTTGLGSPKSAALVSQLVNCPSSGELAAMSHPLASQLSVVLTHQPPSGVISGSAGSLHIRLTNSSTTVFAGPVIVTLTASTDPLVGANPITLATLTLPSVTLRPHASRNLKLAFAYPSIASQGNYYLLASANTLAVDGVPAEARSTASVAIAPPFIKLAPVFAGNSLIHVRAGKKAAASVLIRNQGNTTAGGTFSLNLYASADQTLDASDTLLITSSTRRLNLRSGKNTVLHISFTAPANQVPGYFIIATITASSTSDTGSAVIGTPVR